MAKRRHHKKAGKYCVKVGKRTVSCHRLKRAANKSASRHGGRVVKGHK